MGDVVYIADRIRQRRIDEKAQQMGRMYERLCGGSAIRDLLEMCTLPVAPPVVLRALTAGVENPFGKVMARERRSAELVPVSIQPPVL